MLQLLDMNSFSVWLQGRIDEKGWSKSELARRAGISPTAVSDMLSGRRSVGTSNATAIAKAFNIPTDEVLRAAGILPPKPTKTELIERILNLVEGLPSDEKQDVMDYAEMVYKRMEKRKKK